MPSATATVLPPATPSAWNLAVGVSTNNRANNNANFWRARA